MPESPDLQLEIKLLRDENSALLQVIKAHEATLAQESKRLEEALALLSHEQRDLYQRIERNVDYDHLTGLPNRATLTICLDRSHQNALLDPNYRFAVLWIDIDRFEIVNESMGHLAGNKLLQNIAERLLSNLRSTDTIARLGAELTIARVGGDKFAILLDNIKAVENATLICDRIQQILSKAFVLETQTVFVTASIGVALSATAYLSPEEILQDAAMAMRRAKALGKARSQFFDAEMRANALVRWELETDLRSALQHNELRVFYQSKNDVQSGQIVGFEALLRWQHPRRGLISPLQFIPIAEETGLIVPIGIWVLREACRQLREWNDTLDLTRKLNVSVNVSCCQFADTSLFESIAAVLRETLFDPNCLSLEITETNLMGNTEFAVEVLTKLKTLGVGLMIDDFGTGYSSLSYLAQFPFDTLKIDQSFVKVMDKDQGGVEIVRTMLALADNLGMEVIAEGVETEAHLEKLRMLGCRYAQGYLFSKPLPAGAAGKLLANLCQDTFQEPSTATDQSPKANWD